jgi:hypothetical protein
MKRHEYISRNHDPRLGTLALITQWADPKFWNVLDTARRKKTGRKSIKAWWRSVKTIRVRLADNVMEESHFTIIEVMVKEGEVLGVHVLQRGIYAHGMSTGPFLFWKFDDFAQWFSHEGHPADDVETFRQLWHKDAWVGHQTALAELIEVFR